MLTFCFSFFHQVFPTGFKIQRIERCEDRETCYNTIFASLNSLYFEANCWIFIRLAWIYHYDRSKTCLVFDNLDLTFKVIVLYVAYLFNLLPVDGFSGNFHRKSIEALDLVTLTPFARSLESLAMFTKTSFLELEGGI